MENNTSEEIDDSIKPVFESNGSFISALVFLPVGAFGVTLFSVYLIVCISRIKGNKSNNQIKPILHLTIIDTTFGVALICRGIFAVFSQAKQTYETCAVWSYILVTIQSVSYYHILATCIYRCRVIRSIGRPVPVKQGCSHGIKSLAIWIAVSLVAIPPYVVWMRPGELLMSCRIDFIINTKGPAIYQLILFCTPWLVTNILYFSIIKHMSCHSSNKILPLPTSDTTRNSDGSSAPVAHSQQDTIMAMTTRNTVRNIALNREKSIVRTIGILLVAFNISILSYIVILLETLISSNFTVPAYVFILGLLNNLLNPFVYAFSVSNLRHEMKNNLVTMWTSIRRRLL